MRNLKIRSREGKERENSSAVIQNCQMIPRGEKENTFQRKRQNTTLIIKQTNLPTPSLHPSLSPLCDNWGSPL